MTETIRPTEPKDLPQLAKFLIRVYQFPASDPHADEKFLQWKYLSPILSWQLRSYLLERDAQIVAHCGLHPITFCLPDGTKVNSGTMMDWAAEHEAAGAGVRLFRKLGEMLPTSFAIGGTPNARLLHPRMGYRHKGEVPTYTAWLRPFREFRTRLRTRKSALRLLHGLTHSVRNREGASAGWDFVIVNRFDDAILPILRRKSRSWTYCQRDLADLNHLLNCPRPKMQGFLLMCHAGVMGYFVIANAGWESRLIDLDVNSGDINDWNLACATMTRAAKLAPEACRIRTLASFPILREALEWNGYWPQYTEPLVVYDPSNSLDHAFPMSIQLFDGDAGY